MKEGAILKNEVLLFLDVKPGGFYIDGTAGCGYLSSAVLEKLGADGRLLMLDIDGAVTDALVKQPPFTDGRVIVENESYCNIPSVLKKNGLRQSDGIFFDFGVGTPQLNSARGFSFLKNSFLDMRYSEKTELRAWDVVNTFSEKQIADILFEFGGEFDSRKIARRIIRRRTEKPINTSGELAETLMKAKKRGKTHPATKTFQAIRIYINGELENISAIFGFLPKILRPGGRAVFLSYHSLEDRIVKNAFKTLEKEKKIEILTKKPLTPDREQRKDQPRNRSAKLRAFVLL